MWDPNALGTIVASEGIPMRILRLILALACVASCGSAGGTAADAGGSSDSNAADAVNSCKVSVLPQSGNPTTVFEVTGSGFPAGSMTMPTKVLLEFSNPSGVATTRTFLTLIPDATSFTYRFHEQEAPQEPVPPPLDRGTWHVLGEDERHTCSTEAIFVVQ